MTGRLAQIWPTNNKDLTSCWFWPRLPELGGVKAGDGHGLLNLPARMMQAVGTKNVQSDEQFLELILGSAKDISMISSCSSGCDLSVALKIGTVSSHSRKVVKHNNDLPWHELQTAHNTTTKNAYAGALWHWRNIFWVCTAHLTGLLPVNPLRQMCTYQYTGLHLSRRIAIHIQIQSLKCELFQIVQTGYPTPCIF